MNLINQKVIIGPLSFQSFALTKVLCVHNMCVCVCVYLVFLDLNFHDGSLFSTLLIV